MKISSSFLRLTPVYVIMMLIYIYLVPHIVDGPFTLLVGQDVGENPIDFCKRYWWTNVLYVNNFVPTDTTHQVMTSKNICYCNTMKKI